MSGAAPVERRGRRRRFDEATERTMLLDAAVEVMGRRGYAETSVADVLAESGLSTRSFYRHFESKDALLDALVRREVASVVRHVERAVTGAGALEAGVVAWIDALLDTFFDPGRAARGALFSSPNVVASSPIADELETFRADLCRPLAELLEDAAARGDVVSSDPAADAATVFAVVADTARRAAAGGADPGVARGAVRDQILRFVRPVLLTGP